MRSSFAILVMLLLALTAMAQMRPAQNQAPSPNAQPQTLGGAPNQSQSGAPSDSSNNPQAPSSKAGGHLSLIHI